MVKRNFDKYTKALKHNHLFTEIADAYEDNNYILNNKIKILITQRFQWSVSHHVSPWSPMNASRTTDTVAKPVLTALPLATKAQ